MGIVVVVLVAAADEGSSAYVNVYTLSEVL